MSFNTAELYLNAARQRLGLVFVLSPYVRENVASGRLVWGLTRTTRSLPDFSSTIPAADRCRLLCDLVWMDVEILRELDHDFLALDGSYRHFRLECRAVVPALSSRHGLILARSIMPLLREKSTYPGRSVFRNHLYGASG